MEILFLFLDISLFTLFLMFLDAQFGAYSIIRFEIVLFLKCLNDENGLLREGF